MDKRGKPIWHKPNRLPENVKDRFVLDYENVYHFTKQEHYYFETQYEPYHTDPKILASYAKDDDNGQAVKDYDSALAQNASDSKRRIIASMRRNGIIRLGPKIGGNRAPGYGNPTIEGNSWKVDLNDLKGRIRRSVWGINTQGTNDPHFAPFPEELCEIPIQACCRLYICNKCGLPRYMLYEETLEPTRPGNVSGTGKSGSANDPNAGLHNSDLYTRRMKPKRTPLGFDDCGCNAGWHPGIVLDPFAGRGTAGYCGPQAWPEIHRLRS